MNPLEWDCLIGYARDFRRRLPRVPLLTGPLLSASTGSALALMLIAVPMAYARVTAPAIAFVTLGAILALWCMASRMSGHWRCLLALGRPGLRGVAACRARPEWTDEELDALDDWESLEQVLDATEAPPERKCR
jgi:hypothetical protein